MTNVKVTAFAADVILENVFDYSITSMEKPNDFSQSMLIGIRERIAKFRFPSSEQTRNRLPRTAEGVQFIAPGPLWQWEGVVVGNEFIFLRGGFDIDHSLPSNGNGGCLARR